MSLLQTELIFERMKNALSLKTNKELAEKLEVSTQTLSGWKVRNSLPLEELIKFAALHKISTDWLLFGQESDQLDTAQQMALTAFNALDPKKKIEAISFMSGLQTTTSGGVNQTASGNGRNNHQAFYGNIGNVTGIKK